MGTGSDVGQSHNYLTSIDTPAVETTPVIRADAPDARAGAISTNPIFVHRIFTRGFNVAGVNRFTPVTVSLTEVFPATPGAALNVPGIGGATMKVYNVAPRDGGGVDVRGEVDWDSDIPVRVSFVF